MKRIIATRRENRGNRRKNNQYWQEKVIGNKRIKRALNQKREKRYFFDELQKHTKGKNINRKDLRAALATMKYDTSNPITAKEARIIGKELGVKKIKLRHLRKEDIKEIDRRLKYDHRQDRSSRGREDAIGASDTTEIDRRTGLDHRQGYSHQREYVQEDHSRETDRRVRLDPRSTRSPQKQKNHLSAIDQINKSHRASHTLSGVDNNQSSPTIRRSMRSHRAQAKPLNSAGSSGNFNTGASESHSTPSIEESSHNLQVG